MERTTQSSDYLIYIIDIILRVPPLFILHSILNKSFLVPLIPENISFFGPTFIIWVLIILSFFCAAMVMLVLSTNQLIEVYLFLGAAGLLIVSYYWNKYYITTEVQQMTSKHDDFNSSKILDASDSEVKKGDMGALATNTFLQISIGYMFNMLGSPARDLDRQNRFQYLLMILSRVSILFSLMFPSLICLTDPSVKVLWVTPVISVIIPIIQLHWNIIWNYKRLYWVFKRGYLSTKHMLQLFGLQTLVESEWTRLHVPQVLQVYWITSVGHQAVALTISTLNTNYDISGLYWVSLDDVFIIVKTLLVKMCETFISLIATTSMVSVITHYIGIVMSYLVMSDNEEDRNMGTVSAILFLILALQTGLTSLSFDDRLTRLYRNICLLSTAILHFIHSMCNPLLMTLSASRSMNIQRHVRVLLMCVALITLPALLLYCLWSIHSISTWLLAVSAFSIEVIIKVLISLLIYTLFMIDAYMIDDSLWESLDDYVYYIKSTGNTIEFIFGIFLFCNGAWIMMFESGGTIRAFMMCIHAYFNIWVQAKEGWKIFMKRRTAVHKINMLPEASEEQLDSYNDVCAICYQELTTARITKCQHYFHGVCLRKWLYGHDNCPMCHKMIYEEQTEQNERVEENEHLLPNGLRHEHQD
ncbi:unnamed protein product [Owenia fusiformis]|uniref:RING-type domain-containing protein n=1 Tax=Owenia fusiformis TaxID=6347 RepID=A0A8S4NPM5_OWEFU|nr:unnamed protein product [Owenia fusiformis]